jgi:hypothetical protein
MLLDNVANLAIEGCLMADVRGRFTPAEVMAFSSTTVDELFGDPAKPSASERFTKEGMVLYKSIPKA